MSHQELIRSVDELMAKLREVAGEEGLPTYVRLCEGTDPKRNNEFFNKRLFIGELALWTDISVDSDNIKKAIVDQGYAVTGEQRVPDGFGRNYDSNYYRLVE